MLKRISKREGRKETRAIIALLVVIMCVVAIAAYHYFFGLL